MKSASLLTFFVFSINFAFALKPWSSYMYGKNQAKFISNNDFEAVGFSSKAKKKPYEYKRALEYYCKFTGDATEQKYKIIQSKKNNSYCIVGDFKNISFFRGEKYWDFKVHKNKLNEKAALLLMDKVTP